jgi:hypothetical protein
MSVMGAIMPSCSCHVAAVLARSQHKGHMSRKLHHTAGTRLLQVHCTQTVLFLQPATSVVDTPHTSGSPEFNHLGYAPLLLHMHYCSMSAHTHVD